jgi:hypothetical protein
MALETLMFPSIGVVVITKGSVSVSSPVMKTVGWRASGIPLVFFVSVIRYLVPGANGVARHDNHGGFFQDNQRG